MSPCLLISLPLLPVSPPHYWIPFPLLPELSPRCSILLLPEQPLKNIDIGKKAKLNFLFCLCASYILKLKIYILLYKFHLKIYLWSPTCSANALHFLLNQSMMFLKLFNFFRIQSSISFFNKEKNSRIFPCFKSLILLQMVLHVAAFSFFHSVQSDFKTEKKPKQLHLANILILISRVLLLRWTIK